MPNPPIVRTDEGHLALHEAALGGHLSVVRLLACQPGILEDRGVTQSISDRGTVHPEIIQTPLKYDEAG